MDRITQAFLFYLPSYKRGGQNCLHAPCPVCANGHMSMVIFPPSERSRYGHYFCRSCGDSPCGAKGSFMHYLHEYCDMSYPEAKKALGIVDYGYRTSYKPQANTQQPKEKLLVAPVTFRKQYGLFSSDYVVANPVAYDACVRYLHSEELHTDGKPESRHISRGTCLVTGIGVYLGGAKLSRRDWGMAQREAPGRYDPDQLYIPAPSIIMPIRRRINNETGEATLNGEGVEDAIGFVVRRLGNVPKDKRYYEVYPTGRGYVGWSFITPVPIPFDPPAPPPFDKKVWPRPLFLLEGILDAVLLWDKLDRSVNCAAPCGSKPWSEDIIELAKDEQRTSCVIAVPDNDIAGDVAWKKWQNQFRGAIKLTRVKPNQAYKDLGEQYNGYLSGKVRYSLTAWGEAAINFAMRTPYTAGGSA